jgi:hypothetical protein
MVRQLIVRQGVEWGPRFEFRSAVQLQTLLGRITAFLTQVDMPSVSGTRLQSGVDYYVVFNGRAYALQLKATRDPNPLTLGSVWFESDPNGALRRVRGPNASAQLVKDAVRRRPWRGWSRPRA